MRKIVVGVDRSRLARDVLARAVDLAVRSEARLVVLRAVAPFIEVPTHALLVSPERLRGLLVSQASRALEELVASVPPGRLDRAEARVGPAWQVLCDAARECEAELIVLGAHGSRRLTRSIGSTAARVLSNAPCSVFVVRTPEDGEGARPLDPTATVLETPGEPPQADARPRR